MMEECSSDISGVPRNVSHPSGNNELLLALDESFGRKTIIGTVFVNEKGFSATKFLC